MTVMQTWLDFNILNVNIITWELGDLLGDMGQLHVESSRGVMPSLYITVLLHPSALLCARVYISGQ